MSIIEQYKTSLKVIEAEEFIDLLFFRPLAFIFVKLIYPTSLTPNQISVFSMIFGILAGVSIGMGTVESVFMGGILLATSSMLDCADGQLARLKKNGTLFGRLLDGTIDYVSTLSIFLGIGFWGAYVWGNPVQWWLIIIVTGITYAVQAGLVDYYRSEYISNVEGKSNFVESELEGFQKEFDIIKNKGGKPVSRALLSLYINYSKLQSAKKKNNEHRQISPEDYVRNNKSLIRLWNLNGTATHAFILIICAFTYRLDWYIWYILIIGNLLTIILWLLQKYSDNKAYKELETVTDQN